MGKYDTKPYHGRRRDLTEPGWYRIDTVFTKEYLPKVGPTVAAVYLALAAAVDNEKQQVTLYRATLAERAGLSTKQLGTVDRALATLVELGIVHIQAHKNGRNSNTAHTYTLTHRSTWAGAMPQENEPGDFERVLAQWLCNEYSITNPALERIVKNRQLEEIMTTINRVLGDGNAIGLAVSQLLADPYIQPSGSYWERLLYDAIAEACKTQDARQQYQVLHYGCDMLFVDIEDDDETLVLYSPIRNDKAKQIAQLIADQYRRLCKHATITHWRLTNERPE